MSLYSLLILDEATRDLAKLDKQAGRLIARRIQWLAENLEVIKPEAYTGDLAGFFKFRIGDYRVIYERLDNEQLLIIHQIDHRRDIYRRK
ncbi:MAG: type II toxin-antitoxin system RelE/ParE family toxin [Chloroflexi bacterium]|nr:type II toxin-antitoxin system RelE/ParE family toxin [Chloroflexota bacterium]MBI3742328.1 type II toxin-antitoxin system RelE/ParE family toxin [Chloroflexota bacterium]